MKKWYLSTEDKEGVGELSSKRRMTELAKTSLNIWHAHQRL